MAANDGKLVQLENGRWAQYRQLPVINATAPLLVAVELSDEEVEALIKAADPLAPEENETLH